MNRMASCKPSEDTMLLLLTTIACRGVDPAPEDLDGLVHYFWQHPADDEALAEGTLQLHAAVGADLEDTTDGVLSRLTDEEVALVDGVDDDPAQAAGIYMVNRFACDFDVLEQLLVATDQAEQRRGTYESYERTYTSDAEAYLAGTVPELTWDISLEATVVLSTYSSELSGGIRRVDTEAGRMLFARTWFREPASFRNNNTWDQDYQMEVYYERAPGDIVHLYAMWRELEVSGFSSESESIQRSVLNGMADWDRDTEDLCAEAGT